MEIRKYIINARSYRIEAQRNYRKLGILKAQDNSRAFYALFVSNMPQLSMYINTGLNKMEDEGVLLSNFYKVNDFIDELFLKVYDKFDSVKTDDEFYVFIFLELNELLKNAAQAETLLHKPLENIELYAQAESDKMKEKMAAQLDGDIIL
jgi:hypothetical protein